MQTTLTTDQLVAARGESVYARDGEKIGSVEEIFVDEETGEPEWIGIGTGFLGTKRVVVPVAGAELTEDGIRVPYTKDHVDETPDLDSDDISQETESRLYAHYGLAYSEQRSGTGLPEGGPPTRPEGSANSEDGTPSLTRSEEELRVGKRPVQAGRARLRKWVETEPVQAEVELRRETVQVQREPIDRTVTGAEIAEEEVEVPVHAEEPVVEKRAIARERVSLEKEVETQTERVLEDVRKERVDVEEEPAR